jgi:hypothetical protein
MDEYDIGDDYWGDITSSDSTYDISDDDWSDFGYGSDYGVEEIPNAAQPGEEAYGWKYYSDGTAISPTGTYYYQGEQVWSPSSSGIGTNIAKALMGAFTKPSGGVDWRNVATVGGGLMGLLGVGGSKQQPTGYQGKIPEYTAVRERVQDTYDPNRRPGSSGQRFFSDVRYAGPEGVEAARTAAQEEAAGLTALNKENPAVQRRPETQNMATGGIAGLKEGKYLSGTTDGMGDKLAAKIDNKQPAALSHGEFVIPADVVSHLGNGNSDAGAKKLYEMMEKIRLARTGNPKQGKRVNPNKFLPA